MNSFRNEHRRGERGSGLAVILIIVTMLLGLSAALTLTSMVGVRAASDSEGGMRAFYLADTGAQIGIAKIRAANWTQGTTTFTESVASGSAIISITKPAFDLYQVRSTGTCGSYQKLVEVYVRYSGGFSLDGAAAMTFGPGTEIKRSDIPVNVGGGTTISGQDHDLTGALLAVQSEATYALAMNKVPGTVDFGISGTGTVEGTPSGTTNNSSGQMSILTALRDNAASSADIVINGSKTLDNVSTGSYGTVLLPKLVYAKLMKDESIVMSESFTGYGTLVIEVQVTAMTDTTVLDMKNFATWNGLVMVYFRDKAKEKGDPLVRLANSARIVGGLSVFFNTNKVQISKSGAFLETSGTAGLLYSKAAIAVAPGVSILTEKSAEVTCYRLP